MSVRVAKPHFQKIKQRYIFARRLLDRRAGIDTIND